MFIDEAHLVFEEATDSLMDQMEAIIKLIRSKAVGIFFVTQNPVDIPDSILSQLGMKIQHALRAFTAKDWKAIRLAAQNFPESEYYEVDELLTQLGIGEALVTVLNEKGIPTPLVHTMMRAPKSRMDVLTAEEIRHLISQSKIIRTYNEEIDRESAYEILQEKIEAAREAGHQQEMQDQLEKARRTRGRSRQEKSTLEKIISNPTTRQIGRTVARELTRGLLSAMGVRTTTRRKRRR
jgi:DNA helicase HerA-like ATPase